MSTEKSEENKAAALNGSGTSTINVSPEAFLPTTTASAVPPPPADAAHATYLDSARLLGHKEPLKYSGLLDGYKRFDVTPSVGTEFQDVNLVEWLQAPNAEAILRDLAIMVSRRGVCFFRAQDGMTLELQKELVQKIGLASGKPQQNGLHIWPFVYDAAQDPEVVLVDHKDTDGDRVRIRTKHLADNNRYPAPKMWHSDATWEHAPPDYALLRMVDMPAVGGDTMWASGYEVYDRLSRPWQSFLEGLSFTAGNPAFHVNAKANGIAYYEGQRGAPENVGKHVQAIHPVVRTNPVTGWNSVFAIGAHAQHINGVTPAESEDLMNMLLDMVTKDHGIQCRFRWTSKNDIAIWDNRSMLHTPTADFSGWGLGDRLGYRTMSVGERAYFDPQAVARTTALFREEKEKEKGEEC